MVCLKMFTGLLRPGNVRINRGISRILQSQSQGNYFHFQLNQLACTAFLLKGRDYDVISFLQFIIYSGAKNSHRISNQLCEIMYYHQRDRRVDAPTTVQATTVQVTTVRVDNCPGATTVQVRQLSRYDNCPGTKTVQVCYGSLSCGTSLKNYFSQGV